ncbi:MAG TPA: hypothetical protein VKP13_10645 [Nitrospira sp.]|nr:hypothetical protein [Nitrospira sp.]
MKILAVCLLMILPATMCWAESETEKSEQEKSQAEEPKLYDHYRSLKRMQESLAGRSLDEQARLQPQIQREERKACERLRKERRERVPKEDYRRQGGDEFLVFAQQFEQYCETIR